MMSFDVYLAFGGVAALGVAGFLVAWFSTPARRIIADKAALKQQMMREVVQAESLLQRLSQQVNLL